MGYGSHQSKSQIRIGSLPCLEGNDALLYIFEAGYLVDETAGGGQAPAKNLNQGRYGCQLVHPDS